MPSRPARVVGLVVAGHLVRAPARPPGPGAPSAADVLPFIAFATLAAIVVYRSGSILAAAATHAVMNMFTIIAFGGAMSQLTRSDRHRRAAAPAHERLRLRPPRGTTSDAEPEPVTVIDLRDGVTPTVREAGGPPRPVLEPRPEPSEVPADTRSDIG